MEKNTLEGKVAVVTGAASGIGRAAAGILAEAGAQVLLLDINRELGEKKEKEIVRTGGAARFFHCDAGSAPQCRQTIEHIVQEFGRIDILVNSAGLIIRKDTVDLTEEEWDLVLNVNLKSVFLLSRLVIPQMRAAGGGSIVNIGSGWGLKGGPKAAAYCAAKGGIVNLTRAMAIDCGADKIRVNCICPGDVDTPLLRGEADQLGCDPAVFMKEAAARPLGRVGSPEDIASAVLYFASEMSSWTTGAVLVVDGGGLA